MFMLYKFLFFTCIQLYYVQPNNIKIINIAILSIIIIILLTFFITSFFKSLSPLYNKLL